MIYLVLFIVFAAISQLFELVLFYILYLLARSKGFTGRFYSYRLITKRNLGLVPLDASFFAVLGKMEELVPSVNIRYLYVIFRSKSVDFDKLCEVFQLCIDKGLKNVNQNMILFYSASQMKGVLNGIRSMDSNKYFQNEVFLRHVGVC